MLRDIELAKTSGIDDERLWTAHRNVNDRFRAQYTHTSRSRPVERRKLDAEYLRYLKAAQKFYRGYIYNLATAYGGIAELQEAAEKVERGNSGEHVDAKRATDDVRERVLRSCCTSLSQLGDLSRYRETQLPSKDKGPDWSHAVGYYELAQAVLPRSGLAQNQLAVVAIADNNNFRSVYHLYLSLVAMEPHPHAFNNLKKALFKIRNLRETGRLFQDSGPGRSASHIVRAWYLQVISNCFHGKAIAQQDQLEKEYLQHLESFIANGSRDATLYKITLINIAAGHHARILFEKDSESEDRMNSYLQFLRLNIKTLTVILRALESELRQTENSSLTPTTQKLLPALRIYSAWLIGNGRIVAGATQLDPVSIQQPLWVTYVQCLTLMVSVFPPVAQLPQVPYLLEEDENTIGFEPLHGENTKDIWQDENHQSRRPRRQVQVVRTTNVNEQEHLSRVGYILRTGLFLAMQSDLVPLAFSSREARFYLKSTEMGAASSSTNGDAREDVAAIGMTPSSADLSAAVAAAPVSAVADDEDLQAARMVDSLVSDEADVSSPALHALGGDFHARESGTLQLAAETVRDATGLALPQSSVSPHSTPSPHQLLGSGAGAYMPSPTFASKTLPRSHVRSQHHQLSHSRPGSGGHPRIHPSPLHARVNSNESTRSRSSIWATDLPGSLRSPLGNGTFGIDHEQAIDDDSAENTLLFGAGNQAWATATATDHAKGFWAMREASPP